MEEKTYVDRYGNHYNSWLDFRDAEEKHSRKTIQRIYDEASEEDKKRMRQKADSYNGDN
jgi:hypothetical protein